MIIQEELENLRRQLEENQREMANLEKTWQQKVAEEAAKVRKVAKLVFVLNDSMVIFNIYARFMINDYKLSTTWAVIELRSRGGKRANRTCGI